MSQDKDPAWSVDRHIPISLMIAIIIQTGGAFWWASAVTARIDGQERRLALAEQASSETIKIMTDLRVTLAVISSQLQANQRVIDRRTDGTAP